ncbi:MAG: hypothetical protein OXD29_09130 [Roseovarius sp.]|nr:hypothetical protein [Roseovarius sp.]MCY4208095.1 hypothetical protein [Roseovarius sp.]MCY4293186.1 hypothetical protein [Roseovarius sp.]MCY4316521.1 hypothetical protein [Roseovarius sp.]
MRFKILVLAFSAILVAACGRDKAEESNDAEGGNPLIDTKPRKGVFGGNSRSQENEEGSILDIIRQKREVYKGTLVTEVTEINLEHTGIGAIVRASGVSSRQGAHDVRLVRVSEMPVDGIMSYELRALHPLTTPQGSKNTRAFQAGDYLNSEELEQIDEIRVSGRNGVRAYHR